jgi:hypothetical protein
MHGLKMRLLCAVLLVGSIGSAFADTPGADWMSVEQAKAKLMAAGYSNVTEIEADDGHYEGKGTKDGTVHEFHVDPHTGAITKDEAKH